MKYLVLLTDRAWKSRWIPFDSEETIVKGSTIEVDERRWEVLKEWIDLDDVHLVFCVMAPKDQQEPLPGVRS